MSASNTGHARLALDQAYGSITRSRIAGAKLLGSLHEKFADAGAELEGLVFDHLGEMLDELTAIENSLDEAIDHLPNTARVPPEVTQ